MASSARVLVVDDDSEVLSLVQEALEEDGYGVTPAASLPESLRALEEQLFHFVLTDLFSQPGHAPLQSIQPLLAHAAPIPVGVLTAWNTPDDLVAQADLAFLLHKPFDLDDLQRRLHAHVHPKVSRPRQHQVVEAFFEALNARDWKRLARLCTPEVRVASLSAPAVAAAGAPGGLFGLRAALEARFHRLPGYTIEAVQVYRRPMGVSARYVARWQGSDGLEHRAAGALHFRLEGERIAQIDGAF